MKDKHKSKSGFVLAVALALTGAAMILVGGAIAYTSFATRQTNMMTGKTVCRLAAQSAIEACKNDVNTAFMNSIGKTAHRVGFSNSSNFNWFENSTSSSQTIGKSPNTVTLPATTNINGCIVRVRFSRVLHESGKNWAEVTIIATATRHNPGGSRSSSTIEEKVRFSVARSKVFDNAYFVNNYGWFQGGTTWANGDVRANGDMYLDEECTINGHVYAARNTEIGVPGDITHSGKMDTKGTYKTTTYGVSNRARPLGSEGGKYDAPETNPTDADYNNRLHAHGEQTVEMPFIGDLAEYVEWAEELHGEDSNLGVLKVGTETKATCHYSGAGPSGDAANADKGALVLIGTPTSPIIVNGPVVVDSDVIIKGYVQGQGTIYSGRNIHIVGNIKYVNPPEWKNKESDADNSTKDMLGLMAKGNIVLGDCTSSGWFGNSSIDWNTRKPVNQIITSSPYVQPYACDESDADIGYPSTFGGSYAALDGGKKTVFERNETVELTTGHSETKKRWVSTGWGRGYYEEYQVWVPDTETRPVYSNKKTRHYYDTVCDDNIITRNLEDISQIDAILYNNHGIFGSIGTGSSGTCTINGSLVCRNEGIKYGNGTVGKFYINWDYRLYSGSDESVDNDQIGLARSSDNPPETIAWQEVPDSENPEPTEED